MLSRGHYRILSGKKLPNSKQEESVNTSSGETESSWIALRLCGCLQYWPFTVGCLSRVMKLFLSAATGEDGDVGH